MWGDLDLDLVAWRFSVSLQGNVFLTSYVPFMDKLLGSLMWNPPRDVHGYIIHNRSYRFLLLNLFTKRHLPSNLIICYFFYMQIKFLKAFQHPLPQHQHLFLSFIFFELCLLIIVVYLIQENIYFLEENITEASNLLIILGYNFFCEKYVVNLT